MGSIPSFFCPSLSCVPPLRQQVHPHSPPQEAEVLACDFPRMPTPPHTHKQFPSGDSGPARWPLAPGHTRPEQRARNWSRLSLRMPWGPSLERVGPTDKHLLLQSGASLLGARVHRTPGEISSSSAERLSVRLSVSPELLLPRLGPEKSSHVQPAHCILTEGTVRSCLEMPGEGALHFQVSTGLSPVRLSPGQ